MLFRFKLAVKSNNKERHNLLMLQLAVTVRFSIVTQQNGICGGRNYVVKRFHTILKCFGTDRLRLLFGKYPDLQLFCFSTQPTSLFSALP